MGTEPNRKSVLLSPPDKIYTKILLAASISASVSGSVDTPLDYSGGSTWADIRPGGHPQADTSPPSADPPGQTPPGHPPPNSRRLLLRTVRSLLECILVWQDFCRKLLESERNWTERGPRVPGVPLLWIRQWHSGRSV